MENQSDQKQISPNLVKPSEYWEHKRKFDEWWEKTPQAERDDFFLARDIRMYNEKVGELENYDCQKCKNKGLIAIESDKKQVLVPCDCMPLRKSYARIKESGLGEKFDTCTFDTYKATDEWQIKIKDSALKFVENPLGGWFFIGGQVGSGKTHLCTAIVGELLKKGYASRYCVWTTESTIIKQNITNEETYSRMIRELSMVQVLYIDDFLRGEPTKADFDLVFKIINYRAGISGLITIISSERTIKEICELDEGLGSRIFEKAKQFALGIAKGKEKNYRYKRV